MGWLDSFFAAINTPTSAAAPAPAAQAYAPPPAAAPGAPGSDERLMGWHWGPTQKTGWGGESGGDPTDVYDWLWAEGPSEGYMQPGSFNDGQYTPEQWIAPPGNPTGDIYVRQEGFGGEGGNGTPGGYFDRGSGLGVGQAEIDRATLDQLRQLMGDGDYEQQINNILRATGSETGIGVGGISGLVHALDNGLFPSNVHQAIAPWADAQRAEQDNHRGFGNKFRDWANTELMHFENIGESWQEDPERLLLGINTPAESKLWGGLLGKDYEANVNMYGGPTKETYQESYEAGNDPRFSAAAHGATEGIIGGMVGSYLGGTPFGQTQAGSAAVGAGRAGVAALDSGDSDALRQALLAVLVQQGVNIAAPYVADASNDVLRRMAEGGDSLADASGGMFGAGATPIRSTLGSTTFSPEGVPLSSTPTTTTFGGGGMLPQSVPTEMLPGGAFAPSMLTSLSGTDLDQQDAENLAVLEAGDAPPAEPTVTAADVERYAKVAQTLYGLLGQDEGTPPADAPSRDEGTTDEQYAQELAQYADLDPAVMAAAGLQPGTPAYYEYIMAQMDSVIEQVLGDVDVDSADLAVQLRGKTQAEILQLQRALYVRGQMGSLMGSGTYADPVSGTAEEVIGAGMFNPGTAAYQRGLARNVGELSGLRGNDALSYLNDFLGRDADMFGMQGQADEQYQEALRNDDERRRRGMLTGY